MITLRILNSGSRVGFVTKGSDLTYSELDQNFIDLYDLIQTKSTLPIQNNNTVGQFLKSDGTNAYWGNLFETAPANRYLKTNSLGQVTFVDINLPPSPTGQTGRFLSSNGTSYTFTDITQIPSQVGNANRYLTTNGTTLSWGQLSGLLPSIIGQNGFLFTDGSATYWSPIAHNSLTGVDPNEHIDHSSIFVTGGIGLKNGGSILNNVEIDLGIETLSDALILTPSTDYYVAVTDLAGNHRKTPLSSIASSIATDSFLTIRDENSNVINASDTSVIQFTDDNLIEVSLNTVSNTVDFSINEGNINHNNLLIPNDANIHVDHSTIQVTGTKGISTGGFINSDVILELDYSNIGQLIGSATTTDELIIRRPGTDQYFRIPLDAAVSGGSGGSLSGDYFDSISDGTNTASAAVSKNIQFTSANAGLNILVTENAGGHNVEFTSNTVVNDIIAGTGLSGGGDLGAGNVTLNIDLSEYSESPTVNASSDTILLFDGTNYKRSTVTNVIGSTVVDAFSTINVGGTSILASNSPTLAFNSLNPQLTITGNAVTNTIDFDLSVVANINNIIGGDGITANNSGDLTTGDVTLTLSVGDFGTTGTISPSSDTLLLFDGTNHFRKTINEVIGSTVVDAFSTINGDTGSISASTSSTINLNSANSILGIVANGTDTVNFTINVSNINHNNLLNYVSDHHVPHASVEIVTAASTSGLLGGGDITTTRNLSVDINGTTSKTNLVEDDKILVQQSTGELRSVNVSDSRVYHKDIDFNSDLSTTRILSFYKETASGSIVDVIFDVTEIDSISYEVRTPGGSFVLPGIDGSISSLQSYVSGLSTPQQYYVKVITTFDATFTGVAGVHIKYKI